MSNPFHDQGGGAMARAQKTTDAIGQGKLQVRHLHFGMGLTAQLAHRFNDLGHPTAVGRVVVAQATPIGVDRELSLPGDQLAISDKLTALTFGTKAQIGLNSFLGRLTYAYKSKYLFSTSLRRDGSQTPLFIWGTPSTWPLLGQGQ
jgi:hypothetical protein